MDTFKTTPMVDLIHQVPAPATTHKPPTCDPQVSRYTALTGPDMKGSTRLVFRVIGDFTNPHTGKACPGFDTIAFWANVSKGTVSNAVKELRLLGVLDAEERLTATGKKAFSYTLTHGLATDWTPRPRVDRGGDSLEHFRLRELTRLQQENETLKVRLGIDLDTGEILNERGGEERLCSEIKELDYPPPSVQKNCVHILNTEIERDFHNPPADFDRDYALAALEAYAGEQGWRSTGAAMDAYAADWPRFRADLAKWRVDRANAEPTRKSYDSGVDVHRPDCSTCGKETPPSRLRDGVCTLCRHGIPAEIGR